MKYLQFTVLVCLCTFLNGCLPIEENATTLSFWTDRPLDAEEYTMLFANENHVGNLNDSLEDPICADSTLLNFKITQSEDLTLSIRNEGGDAIEIGVINLFSVSNGIKIKPTEEGKIFVNQSLDDDCILIYLNWNE